MSKPLHYMTIVEIGKRYREGSLSPVEITEMQLSRISEIDRNLHCYATVMAESAMAQAQLADSEFRKGIVRGPMQGIPIAVKDLCFTNGVRTMGGSAVFADQIPNFDSTVVSKLTSAGAVLLGKLNLSEGAMSGYNPKFRYPENPWRKNHFPGASSSGSGAAAAAGLAYGTLGTDTGGSIRFPAAACGAVGLKPTWGLVSRYGVMDLAESLDHVGPLSRSVADSGVILQTIAGPDPNDSTTLLKPVSDMLEGLSKGVTNLRLGWDEQYSSEDMEDDYAGAVLDGVRVMEKLGAKIIPVRMPEHLREYLKAWPVICSSEAANAHSDTYPSRSEEYGPWFRQWLENGWKHTGVDYARANNLRIACNGELRRTFQQIDLMAFPGATAEAHKITPEIMYGPIPDDRDTWSGRFTQPFDFSGYPTISLPCGLSNNGMPLSLQLAGHPLSESLLVQAGHAYEQATDWHDLHPADW